MTWVSAIKTSLSQNIRANVTWLFYMIKYSVDLIVLWNPLFNYLFQ